jgi:endonuclease YncB( thermonuclease family)
MHLEKQFSKQYSCITKIVSSALRATTLAFAMSLVFALTSRLAIAASHVEKREMAAIASCVHDRTAFRCVKYVKNYDADTVTFDIPNVHPLLGDHISIRVNGVDAPEIKSHDECEKHAARIARNLVENLLKRAQRIDLLNIGRDKYFRVLADIIIDGRDLKEVLFKNGLVYEYHGGTKQKMNWCKAASGEARQPQSKQ